MVRRIHHVNFVVRSLDAAIPVWEKVLNCPVTRRDVLPARRAHTARFLVGDTWVVLVEPIAMDSVAGRHLAEFGEGFFLMSLEVESLSHQVELLGKEMFDGSIRSGLDNWRILDLRRDNTFGAQLQFVAENDDES